MANIIIKGRTSIGRNRSEQEENLRKDWGPTMDDGQLDKMKYFEKKAKEKYGLKETHIKLKEVDKVK